jgi:hypothetical protein
MKRDKELILAILAALEADPEADGIRRVEMAIQGRSRREVDYHVGLLHEAGLIEVFGTSDRSHIPLSPSRLTWAGHERLDASRGLGP